MQARVLTSEEVTALLKPLSHGVGKPYYIDSKGEKHYVDRLPPVGGFVSKGPDGQRKYMVGDPDIVAYKDKESG